MRDERRLRRIGAHVDEQQPAVGFDRVRRDADPLVRRLLFERPLEARAGRAVELPAVVRAANPVGLDEPEPERGAAMRAALGDAAERPVAGAQDDQILAQDADALLARFAAEFGGRAHRLPVTAQQRAARRAGADAREPFVLFVREHQKNSRSTPATYSARSVCT